MKTRSFKKIGALALSLFLATSVVFATSCSSDSDKNNENVEEKEDKKDKNDKKEDGKENETENNSASSDAESESDSSYITESENTTSLEEEDITVNMTFTDEEKVAGYAIKDKTLIIINDTAMKDYIYGVSAPWASECEKIERIIIMNGVTRIGYSTFVDFSSLTSVKIPDSVTSIGWFSFSDCSSLVSVMIPDSVQWIGTGAFKECSSLTSIVIPNSVTEIGHRAFSGCKMLKTIDVKGENTNYTSIDGVLFSKDKTVLVRYPAAKEGTTYTVPNSVTRITEYAFEDCSNLKTINYDGSEAQWEAIEKGDYWISKDAEVKFDRKQFLKGTFFAKA